MATLVLGFLCPFAEVRSDELPSQGAVSSTASRIRVRADQDALPVTLDFAKILTFDLPARTIIIGNPSIVDGTLSDEYNLVLTGKAVGVTNMIILGEAGAEIANLRVVVSASASQVTTVYHGSAQQVYSCVDACRPIGKAEATKQQ
ncbi:pilus assembly protein N-terminal domain-containing protein [Microvirga solisilvae]|uniref:pilus assembly protein N-terminal domain-containing protein n=1 Tax=Microvirga solisilvae TaxID=2919498 RepID=UPI001FB037E5|nr:pilus assembly protein N-terminal domain-containing protein [Microvirga solisilvae]